MVQKIQNVKELNAFREKARADIDLRTSKKEMAIVVHMGTCGIAAGARDILNQLMEELGKASIGNVSIRLSGCLGLCDQEPMFTLTDVKGNEFCYANLNKSKVREIVQQHVMGKEPVVEYIVNPATGGKHRKGS